MKVLYILNDSCFYRRLCYISITTLRHFNSTIPVEVLYLCDDGRDSRDIANYNEIDLGVPWFTREMFFETCEKLNVRLNIVKNFDLSDETGYISAQRKEFVRVSGDDILLIDADTFVLDDIEPLFDILKDYDLVADKTGWGALGGRMPIGKKKIIPFNSGVVLFGKGLLQKYGSSVYDICMDIKYEKHPLCAWLSATLSHEEYEQLKRGREEFAFTWWVIQNRIKYRYFLSDEVQTIFLNGKTRIYHTMTQNYLPAYVRFFKNGIFTPPRKIKNIFVHK
jgi:hypothetical protein